MRKGVSGLPPIVIQGVFLSVLILAILGGSVVAVDDFINAQALGINAERISNTALAINSMERGEIELEMPEYRFKVDKQNISLEYEGKEKQQNLSYSGFQDLEGPSQFRQVDGTLCMRKKPDALNFTAGGC